MARKKRETGSRQTAAETGTGVPEREAVFSRLKENLLIGLLVLYVLLLGLGTFGELFEVEWILSLPLFR